MFLDQTPSRGNPYPSTSAPEADRRYFGDVPFAARIISRRFGISMTIAMLIAEAAGFKGLPEQ